LPSSMNQDDNPFVTKVFLQHTRHLEAIWTTMMTIVTCLLVGLQTHKKFCRESFKPG
jgi:hypothetical protein